MTNNNKNIDLSTLDNLNLTDTKINDNNELRRFSYLNPLKHNDFSRRKMYWSSHGERLARILILISQMANIVMAYYFGNILIASIIKNLTSINSSAFVALGWNLTQGVSYLLLIVISIFAFLIILVQTNNILNKKENLLN